MKLSFRATTVSIKNIDMVRACCFWRTTTKKLINLGFALQFATFIDKYIDCRPGERGVSRE